MQLGGCLIWSGGCSLAECRGDTAHRHRSRRLLRLTSFILLHLLLHALQANRCDRGLGLGLRRYPPARPPNDVANDNSAACTQTHRQMAKRWQAWADAANVAGALVSSIGVFVAGIYLRQGQVARARVRTFRRRARSSDFCKASSSSSSPTSIISSPLSPRQPSAS